MTKHIHIHVHDSPDAKPDAKTGVAKLDALLDAYRASGRIAFVHPVKKLISLNGGRAKPYAEVLAYLTNWSKE